MGKIPHVKDLTGVDLSTLDKEELLQAALSYKRAYYTAKKIMLHGKIGSLQLKDGMKIILLQIIFLRSLFLNL